MRQFFATEAAFLSVLLAFNPLSHYQRPATLRSAVFLGGAILGNRARQRVLHIAQSWGGSEKQQPLIDQVLPWRKRTSPKLPSTPRHLLNQTSKLLPNFGIRVEPGRVAPTVETMECGKHGVPLSAFQRRNRQSG